MKHYLYKITNTKTGQFYVGVRSNKNPTTDKYMGSSSVWTKSYIDKNKSILIKEILDDSFTSRDKANEAEVELLHSLKGNKKCVNKLFERIPSSLGKHQTIEHIKKRNKSGKQAHMYGKHHTKESKERISSSLKGRIISKEARIKIGNASRGKIVSEKTKKLQSITKKKLIASGKIKKTYKPVLVYDILNDTFTYFKGCKIFAEFNGFCYGSVKMAVRKHKVYLNRYKIIYTASISDNG